MLLQLESLSAEDPAPVQGPSHESLPVSWGLGFTVCPPTTLSECLNGLLKALNYGP